MNTKKSPIESIVDPDDRRKHFVRTDARQKLLDDLRQIPLEKIVPDPNNPRKAIDEAKIKALADSEVLHGILVPGIVFPLKEKFQIVDGHCRYEAAKIAGLTEFPCVVLASAPQPSTLLLVQSVIECHRTDRDPVSQAEAFSALMRLLNLNATELARELCISNSAVTRALSLLTLDPESQLAIREKKISRSAGYAIARLPVDRRADATAKAARGELTRDDLNKKARRKVYRTAGKRQSRLVLPLPTSTITIVTREAVTADFVINELQNAAAHAKKAKQQGLDTTTLARVMKCSAKAPGVAQVDRTTAEG